MTKSPNWGFGSKIVGNNPQNFEPATKFSGLLCIR